MKYLSEDHKEIQSGKKLDDEGYMAKVEMDKIEQSLEKLKKVIKSSNQQLPAWVQSKITKATDYLDIASDYLSSEVEMDESSKIDMDEFNKRLKDTRKKIWYILKAKENPKPKGPELPSFLKKEEVSLVDKILEEMLGDKPGCDIKSPKKFDAIVKKHKVSPESLKKELKKGVKVEMEHTTDKGEAETIALHHLDELPDYYTRLIAMEKEADKINEAKKYMSKDEDPCWKGYEMVGFKKKRGKKVPNCVPVKEQMEGQGPSSNTIKTSKIKALLDRKKAIESEINSVRRGVGLDQNLEEANTRLPMQTGTLLRVLVNWRGKHLSVQMFFPQLGTPRRDDITYAVNKVYPEARVISYVPCEMDSNTPIVQVREEFQLLEFQKSDLKCNDPKNDPVGDSKTGKSHVVKACEKGKEKLIRFGQRGVKGSPKKKGESKAYKKRRLRFKARHRKNIKKGKMSAAYWADREKW